MLDIATASFSSLSKHSGEITNSRRIFIPHLLQRTRVAVRQLPSLPRPGQALG